MIFSKKAEIDNEIDQMKKRKETNKRDFKHQGKIATKSFLFILVLTKKGFPIFSMEFSEIWIIKRIWWVWVPDFWMASHLLYEYISSENVH